MQGSTKPNFTLSLFPFMLVFYEVSNYLANDMYLPALPEIAKELAISPHYVQTTLTVWFLGAACLQLFFGPLSDRFGRRPVFIGGGIVFIISTIVCAMASRIDVLIVGRFFQGSSIGSIGTAGYSSIHECFSHEKAIKVLAVLGSITVLAPAFGPLLGAIVLHWLDWRWIFGILTLWASLAILILAMWMPESNPVEKRQPLHIKTLWRNYLAIFFNPKFLFNTLFFCLPLMGMGMWISAGSFLVIEKFKYSAFTFGVFQLVVFFSLMIGTQFVNRRLTKRGANYLIDRGLLFTFFASLFGIITAWLLPHNILGLIVSLMLFMFGCGLIFGPAQRLAIEACEEPMGARMAVFSNLLSLFCALGGILVSITYEGTLLWMASLLFAVSLISCIFRVYERKNL